MDSLLTGISNIPQQVQDGNGAWLLILTVIYTVFIVPIVGKLRKIFFFKDVKPGYISLLLTLILCGVVGAILLPVFDIALVVNFSLQVMGGSTIIHSIIKKKKKG